MKGASARTVEIPLRPLGRDGSMIPIIGFGAEALGRSGRRFEDAERTLHAVVDAGVTLIDTASCYGNSERFVGTALESRRDEITIVTKCGWGEDMSPQWSPAEIAATVDTSLRSLRTDRVDVLLLHSCPLETLQRGDVIVALQRLRDAGKAVRIGYSGDNEALTHAVECGAFTVVEASFNMLDRANAAAIAEAHRRGMGVLAKRPLANAVPGRTERPKSDYAAQYWPRWQALGMSRELAALPWLDVAVRFAAFWPGVSGILVGSSHAHHVVEHLDRLRRGALPEEILRRLDVAYQSADRGWVALG